ncbi:olfactory receptor 52D1-like [Carettochelys insculpta]|uniref:olfactory receptor 52D1-like n=1 Tax=Carettochelys insculpta TaxID=44489 RepID=UPI003EBA2113
MSVVPTPNSTEASTDVFTLLGIPGLEAVHRWLSIPLCFVYVTALLGNTLVLAAVAAERRLHQPTYLLLSALAVSDLVLTSATVPKMLLLLWFQAGEISFAACLTQMFFVHTLFMLESAILLSMAFDRYVAICEPLRYRAVVTTPLVGRIGAASVLRSVCLAFPFIVFLKRLPYCSHKALPHTYCEHMGIARLACADITGVIVYGICVTFLAIGFDVVFIIVSYVLILRAVFLLPSKKARLKALRTCGSHICVIFIFYTPAFFSFVSHCFGHNVPRHIHILLANVYVLVPPTLNPIIYGVKTQLIWDRVLKIVSPLRGCVTSQELLQGERINTPPAGQSAAHDPGRLARRLVPSMVKIIVMSILDVSLCTFVEALNMEIQAAIMTVSELT